VALLGVGIVLASSAAFVPCPGVQFSMTVRTTGFEVRIGANGDTGRIRGLLARKVSWEQSARQKASSNDVLSPSAGEEEHVTEAVDAPAGDVVELAELAVPDRSRLEIQLSTDRLRRQFLDLEIEAPPDKPSTMVLVGPADAVGTRPGFASGVPKYRFFEPELMADSTVPLRIAGVGLTAQVPVVNASYAVSRIKGGTVQFIYMNRPVGSQTLGHGDFLRFEGLDAELTALEIDGDALALRIFGTARDVKFGSGAAVSSIHPSLFDGLAAQPWLGPTLGTMTGLALAWFGVLAGLGSRPRSPD